MDGSRSRIEISDPKAYQERLRALGAGRDPVVILGETAEALAALVGGIERGKLQVRPGEGKWSPVEILGHLVDTEWVFGGRLRAILCQDRPRIVGMDQDLWVEGQRHREADPAGLLGSFRALREINLRLWRRLTPRDLARTGLHEERGEESLELLRAMNAGHDLYHLEQLRRTLAAVGA